MAWSPLRWVAVVGWNRCDSTSLELDLYQLDYPSMFSLGLHRAGSAYKNVRFSNTYPAELGEASRRGKTYELSVWLCISGKST